MIRTFIASAAAIAWASAGFCDPNWSTTGFEMPESALFDTTENRIIVSNIKGSPGEADGNGYLSLLAPDGTIIEQQWATGMNAPKGMALVGDQLLVTDMTELRIIDSKTGALSQTIPIENAQFLNDVTSDGNTAWFTDMMTHTIWQYEDGEVTLWMQDPALSHPNGILFDKERLVVGTWGENIQDDFSTETPGALISIDLESKAISVITDKLGNLDGVVRTGDGFLVNDWITGEIFAVDETGKASSFMKMPKGLADISAHGNQLLLPLMLDDEMHSIKF